MNTNEKRREALTEELKTKSICRFCLTQGADDLSNIYAKDTPVKSLLPLPVEVMAVASIEVFLNDGMPSTVCLKCRLIFDYCYRFKQMCKKAESLLSQVPLLGEWPSSLMKPSIPPELLPKQNITQHAVSAADIKEEPQTKSKSCNVANSKATPSKPRKILNSNPADLPEPPIPTRWKRHNSTVTYSFLTKMENDEEISIDDIQRIMTAEPDELGGTHELQQDKGTSPTTSTTKTTKNKPKVLNKSSMRILNKDANIDMEPRLKQPRVKHDEDGNVSIVTEILDPNEPYEAEPDPITTAEPVKTYVFPCPHCDRTFPLLQLRDIHVVNHSRERHYQCSDCERSFFSKYDLQKHVVIHTGERKYKCSVCDKGFTRPALLHRHEKIHTDIPKYICVYCEKPFLSKDDMETHTERHRKNRPFQCKVCNKSFAFKQGLERHEVVHSTEQPYPCQYCDKSFYTPSKLARHLVAHAGNRPFPCKFCSKSYLLSHHLSRHLRTHTESVVMYSCNECDETYKTCEELVLHSAVHAIETLTCPLCQQVFDDAESVKSHIKNHASSKSYPCEFCDLIFLTSNEQVDHVKSTHAYDLAAYNEDQNTTKKAQKDDQELGEAIEEFLHDETIIPDDEKLNITNENDITKQEIFDETANNNQKYMEDNQIYGEEYLKTDELTNFENTIDAEMLTDIIDQQEPNAKKIKVDDEYNLKEIVKIEAVQFRRKTPRRNTEMVVSNTSRKSPRGCVSTEKLTNITKRNEIQIKQSTDESSPSSGDKQSNTLPQTVNQFKVKTENVNNDNTTSVALNENMAGMIVATETRPMSDTVVNMKLGEKRVRVQKIVVTKAEAAVMAKQGRICIKDGNLILTSKTSK